MRRDYVGLWSPAIGAEGGLLAYSLRHGRPLLVFQSEQGRCSDYEDRGMIDAIAGLIEAGRVKVYSVDSYDAASWCDPNLPWKARAAQHGRFEDWILNQVVPFVYDDCQGPLDVMVTGASFGAFHAANFAFRRADLFPLAIRGGGVYDAAQLKLGRARRRRLLQQPHGLRGQPGRRPPGVAAGPAVAAARLRPGHVGGHHRGARVDQGLRPPARREGHPPRDRPVGKPRRPPRLVVLAGPSSPTICRGSSESAWRDGGCGAAA